MFPTSEARFLDAPSIIPMKLKYMNPNVKRQDFLLLRHFLANSALLGRAYGQKLFTYMDGHGGEQSAVQVL